MAGDEAFCFDAVRLKQLWSRPLVQRGEYITIDGPWNFKDPRSVGRKITLRIPNGIQVFDIAMDPRGRWAAAAMGNNRIGIFSAIDGKPIKTLTGHKEWPRRVAVSPDSRWLASADAWRYDRLGH